MVPGEGFLYGIHVQHCAFTDYLCRPMRVLNWEPYRRVPYRLFHTSRGGRARYPRDDCAQEMGRADRTYVRNLLQYLSTASRSVNRSEERRVGKECRSR